VAERCKCSTPEIIGDLNLNLDNFGPNFTQNGEFQPKILHFCTNVFLQEDNFWTVHIVGASPSFKFLGHDATDEDTDNQQKSRFLALHLSTNVQYFVQFVSDAETTG